jgi:3-methyladenine DNA glycosylase AlkD
MSEVRKRAVEVSHSQKKKLKYIGTVKTLYVIETDAQRRIIRTWIKQHSDLTASEYLKLLESLFQGKSVNEVSIAGELLGSMPELRKSVEPRRLDAWLNRLHGWGEVDSLCQSKFLASELLSNWREWESLLASLSSQENVYKKRASLVPLTKPVRDSDDERLADLAFKIIDKLKDERDILVTKAVSWLLRDLVKYNRQGVETYLNENEDTLPKIALRETRMKLLTGRNRLTRSTNELLHGRYFNYISNDFPARAERQVCLSQYPLQRLTDAHEGNEAGRNSAARFFQRRTAKGFKCKLMFTKSGR